MLLFHHSTLNRVQRAQVALPARLRQHLQAWRKITHDPKILELVNTGLLFELKRPPVGPRKAPVFTGSPDVMLSLVAQLKEWLELGVIEACTDSNALFSLLFPVPKPGQKKWRWVLDSKRFNESVVYRPFKMDTVDKVRRMLRRHDWLTSIDLRDAYLHVPVNRAHRRYLAFRAFGRNYQFASMSFGTSSAPRTFTKLLRPVVAQLHREGIRCSVYLDDFLIAAESHETSVAATQRVIELLNSLGLTINREKSVLLPTQRLLHLGLIFDTTQYKIYAPTEKLKALARTARHVLELDARGELTVRVLSRLTGVVISMMPAMRAACRRRHALSRCVQYGLRASNNNWDARVSLSRTARADTEFWASTAPRQHNGQPMQQRESTTVLTTDASEWGWGAILTLPDGREISIKAPWSPIDAARSSNWRESTAIQRAFNHFKRRLRHLRVLTIRSDNSTAISTLRRYGSRHKHLDLALSSLLETALRWRLEINAQHIAGEANTAADRLSRNIATERNEWRLSAAAMRAITARFGAPTIDWFASDATTQLPRFASLEHSPRALYRDAMTADWTGEFGLFVPPINLVEKVIHRIDETRAHGILVVPAWTAMTWAAWLPWLRRSDFLYLPRSAMQVPPAAARHPMRDGRSPQLVAFRV